ncbi:ATP-binding protein [Kitasatospora sp. NPDC049285]|uniref:ATP-binding protein n=1 Tax=Kitasatospora sp. NPDC049285 TaxID=3157096 RepID=UPI00343BD060
MDVQNRITGGSFHGPVTLAGQVVVQPPTAPPALAGLPAAGPALVGRDAELADLLDGLTEHPVQLVTGLPGVGKTALALHTAHRALAEPGLLPGGVLFLDLYGYDPALRVDPHRALGSLLRALAVPEETVPEDPEDRARLYRSVLAGHAADRPLLVLLDNASSAAQLRPLLPGDPRIPVLATSRHTLGGLPARILDLTVLSTADAVAYLDGALRRTRGPGDTRIADQPAAAAEIAELCGGLPLALAVVAALLAELPNRSADAMARALRDTGRRLSRLTGEDLAVRAAFRLSYRQLPPETARLFRLLPLNPGPDLATEALARLADLPEEDAEPLVHALARAHLVEPAPPTTAGGCTT